MVPRPAGRRPPPPDRRRPEQLPRLVPLGQLAGLPDGTGSAPGSGDLGPGQAVEVAAGEAIGALAWAPAGDHLAYVGAQGDLWALDAGALPADRPGAPVALRLRPGTIGRIAWSPDGRWLAYDLTQVLRDNPDAPPDRYAGLWRVRADGTEAAEVLSAGSPAEDGVVLARWAPDGEGLLFWPDPYFSASVLADGLPLMSVPIGGGDTRRLSDPLLLSPESIAVSPSGDALALAVGQGRETWYNKAIQVVSLPGGDARRITGADTAAVSPAWSPDGARLAYVAAPNLPDTAGARPPGWDCPGAVFGSRTATVPGSIPSSTTRPS